MIFCDNLEECILCMIIKKRLEKQALKEAQKAENAIGTMFKSLDSPI